jgi:hypothetical protein
MPSPIDAPVLRFRLKSSEEAKSAVFSTLIQPGHQSSINATSPDGERKDLGSGSPVAVNARAHTGLHCTARRKVRKNSHEEDDEQHRKQGGTNGNNDPRQRHSLARFTGCTNLRARNDSAHNPCWPEHECRHQGNDGERVRSGWPEVGRVGVARRKWWNRWWRGWGWRCREAVSCSTGATKSVARYQRRSTLCTERRSLLVHVMTLLDGFGDK